MLRENLGVLAVACCCLATATAQAQYVGGQANYGPGAGPASDYYSSYNAYQQQLNGQRVASNGYQQVSAPPAYQPRAYGSAGPYGPVANTFAPGTPTPAALPMPGTGSPNAAESITTQGPNTPGSAEPSSPNDLPVPGTGVAPGSIPGLNYGGGCATGTCGPSGCNVGCGCSCGCCAGWMGPGPLFNYGPGLLCGKCGCGSGGGLYGPGAGGYGSGDCQGAGGIGPGFMGPGAGGFASGFYAQAGALMLWRDNPNKLWTTFDENNASNQLMNTQQAKAGAGYGGQVTIGHCLSCSCAVEATYWGLSSMTGSTSITSPTNSIGTPLDLSFLPNFGNGNAPGNYFDGAHEHRITRQDNIQNAEINFLAFPQICPMGQFRAAFLGGFRYFSFNDALTFGSAADGTNFGDNGGATEAFLYSKTTNSLFGFQFGSRLYYYVTPKVALFAVPKIGIYNNYMTEHTSLYTGDGFTNFSLSSHKNGFATLCEIDLGAQYYFTPRLSVFAAYRLIGVTGVALADNMIPHYVNDAPAIQDINHNGNLVLQGLYTGLQWNF